MPSRAGVVLAFGCGLACRAAPDTPLTAAAAAGQTAEIARLLGAGAAVDAADSDGWTPLIWAARGGQQRSLALLLEAGADPRGSDTGHTRWPPLVHAVHHRQLGCARLLLDAGADPEAGSGTATPLMFAAAYGDAALVRELLRRGADPQRSDAGFSALGNALGAGWLFDFSDGPPLGRCHPEVVQALLEARPELAFADRAWMRLSRAVGGAGCRDALARLGQRQASAGPAR